MSDTRGAHVLPDVSIAFRERTCKHQSNVQVNTRAKGNPMKAVREDSIVLPLQLVDLQPKNYQK